QPRVGQQLELQRDPALTAGQPPFGEPGRLVGRAGEPLVPSAPGAAPCQYRSLPGSDEVMSRPVGFDQRLGSGRNADLENVAVGSVPQGSLPMAASLRLEVRPTAECLQIAERVV